MFVRNEKAKLKVFHNNKFSILTFSLSSTANISIFHKKEKITHQNQNELFLDYVIQLIKDTRHEETFLLNISLNIFNLQLQSYVAEMIKENAFQFLTYSESKLISHTSIN